MSARKWTLRGMAGAALLACATGPTPAQTPPPRPTTAAPVSKPAAVVNGEAINMAELDGFMRLNGPPSAVSMTEKQVQQMREEWLNMMIEDVLMHQFLRKYCPQPTPKQIAEELAEMAKELHDKHGGKTLQDLYKESGRSEAEWRESIAYRLQWMAYCKEHITDSVVKRYYDENKDFFDNVTVRASHVVIRIDPKMSPTDVAAVKAKLTALRQQLLENKIDFATAAQQNSECLSAKDGGDIGFFPRKGMVDENFARMAFALQPGQVSDVVQTSYGLHLIKVTERKPGTPSDFNKIKDDVRMFCTAEFQQNIINQLHQSAKIEKNL
jgi:PPIC-type PPIASE domain